ncbi:LodA/GoxA family CTQ-dependent oxidase [Mesorhizobium kowhaii]|uniref:LodA/GoxA family CTQ-dependent oxidase n=1 Tax=Mesorhizobium kowhaii TaxID=1300272 RepID=UPI0035F0C1EE
MAKDAKQDTPAAIDCVADPIGSLKTMFVDIGQGGGIERGQCPVRRPVFLKPHGVAHGKLVVRENLPDELRVGLFAGSEYPAWVRFSSDTAPTVSDFKTTVGIGVKLFNVPGAKLVGNPDDVTADLIFQNHDRFFVDTASDMCAFTQAGVVEHDYDKYLKQHPLTAQILDEMAKPVVSVLAETYWGILPFSFGEDGYVKYRLEPTLDLNGLTEAPVDPTYLAADLQARLASGPASFRFSVQHRTDPATMPLDAATVRWDELVSPWIWIADLHLDNQDVAARGQAEYGENLAMNIWRVPAEHAPVGSIAEARKVVYAASADQRRNINGIPVGEPEEPRPIIAPPPARDTRIVSAKIHPGIGIARIGDSANEFFVGPEVVEPAAAAPGFYRDAGGALKRQAARFRVYGYNAAGEVIRELTGDNAAITWTVHLANRKASWYRFLAALDIPDAVAMIAPRRNPDVTAIARASLEIDPGPRSIAGADMHGGAAHNFDTGMFKKTVVALGELRTDEKGRLLVLGGLGRSASPSGAPVFKPDDMDSFNNADDWFDDISDGPVDATISIAGRAIPVTGAWVAVAPPNYGTTVIGWRTLYDLLVDTYVEAGWMPFPSSVSFSNDILPVIRRLTNLQWVNKGFAALFGFGGPMDFNDPTLIGKLALAPKSGAGGDPHRELRARVVGAFRPVDTTVDEPRLWSWIYGDAFGSFDKHAARNNLALGAVQSALLERWAAGDFVNDWDPAILPPQDIAKVPLGEQPATLDRAALHFCLADAFHPGCELTWPMRHASLYQAPFRIKRRSSGNSGPDYGSELNQTIALKPGGPLYEQGPGDLSRWMALPWQGDTAFCRSGYDPSYDPFLPTFWAARVPNQVLTEAAYHIVVDQTLPRDQRIAAFNQRAHWLRSLSGPIAQQMTQMIAHFGALGVVEVRPGVPNDPDFPETMLVETLPPAPPAHMISAMAAAEARSAAAAPTDHVSLAGWESVEQLEEFRRVRVRNR